MLELATQTKQQVLRNTFLNSKVSKQIHDQGTSLFCWAFAISSMLRQSLKIFLQQLSACDQFIEKEKIVDALKNLERNEFHTKLRNELIMLPIPKVNRASVIESKSIRGSHYLERAVERVSLPITLLK